MSDGETHDAPSIIPKGDTLGDSLLTPSLATRIEYGARVAQGHLTMQKRRVVIAGLVRDLADILPLTIRRVEAIGNLFADYRVVIYENDSIDGSLKLLNDWAHHNEKVNICTESRQDPVNRAERCLSRAARMAYYRSQCQTLIRQRFSDFENVVLVDMDLEGGWSLDGIANTFGHSDWDFIGAYGIIFRRQLLAPNCITHYDAWAYRVDDDFTPLSTKEVNSILFRNGDPLQPVTSCFGGLGVYQMPAYLNGRYDGSDVEHVSFHRHMRSLGFRRTYLNPSQITIYGRKHRTLDHVAAQVIRMVDAIPGRPRTEWNFPKDDRGVSANRRAA